MAETKIEWADMVWNPVIGCTRVSEGCRHCYAERAAARMISGRYAGLVKIHVSKPEGELVREARWTGKVRLVESALDLPLRWRHPRRIFVNSMGDLFHEKMPDEWIDQVFATMAWAPRHTFQVLTKRPERMRLYLDADFASAARRRVLRAMAMAGDDAGTLRLRDERLPWPLPNVWLGVSVEDQPTADERIPLLLQTPAALRWVSYEPAIAAVDFAPFVTKIKNCWMCPQCGYRTNRDGEPCPNDLSLLVQDRALDWVVVGGESGPGARPFDLAWARSAIVQCRAAGVPVFVKQLGARPISGDDHMVDPAIHHAENALRKASWVKQYNALPLKLGDRKGGDPAEWPENLRVREWPR